MGKYSKDKRKYKRDWKGADWAKGSLQHIDEAKNHDLNTVNEAYCKVCQVSLRSHKADLQKHANSKIHITKMSAIQLPKKSTMLHYATTHISDQQKIADIKLAAYIASHSAIRSMDHLCNVLKSLGKGSILENIRLHRTKCSSIIQNVIAPTFLVDLVNAVGDKGYSLIVDESTDVSVTTLMCLCVRYFNTDVCHIMTDFLGIFIVEEATADCLYKNVTDFHEFIKLPMKNMIAIGTDGANNLCGCNHSLYTLLKKDIPNLQLLKCACHSIHLCYLEVAKPRFLFPI